MKTLTYTLLTLILLVGCTKNKEVIQDETYQKLIGKWKNIEGEVPIYMEFTANGIIKEHKPGQQSLRFKANEIVEGNTYLIDGGFWTFFNINSRIIR